MGKKLSILLKGLFWLIESGIILEEVAPGIDIHKDIISKMGFMPILGSIKEMDHKIFNEGKMGIRDEIMQTFNSR